jgi:thiol-disulfide isomerase/thioredoxin
VIVLDFYATWCPPCRTAMPALVALAAARGEQLVVVGVTRRYGRGMDFVDGGAQPHGGTSRNDLALADELALNTRFAEAFRIVHPLVVSDETTWGDFSITAIPTVFVVGRDGNVTARITASGSDAERQLAAAVDQALAVGK